MKTIFSIFTILICITIGSAVSAQQKLQFDIYKLPKNGPGFPTEVIETAAVLQKFYSENGKTSIWLGTSRMDDLIDRMKSALEDGLNPEDYPVAKLTELKSIAGKADQQSQAIIEIWFSAYFLKYASDLKLGRFKPRKVDPELHWRDKKIDRIEALRGLSKADSIDEFFSNWEPANPAYRVLKQVLQLYLTIEEKGGWPTITATDTLRPGMVSPQTVEIRNRLAATSKTLRGYTSDKPELYDGKLVDAVKNFQKRHGLEPDGVVGPTTHKAMNVTASQRIQQILISMERWRWMPEDYGKNFIAVNIARYKLLKIDNLKITEEMRVIVGQPYHRTPVFSDKIEYLVLNPYWNVPYSIATKELLPKLKRNAASVAADGFEVVKGKKVIDLASVDWSQYSGKNFPFLLRQKPGKKNALGRVKFMFPNRFNVYLHDTPSHLLFDKAKRAFSHGCIRVHRPVDLAEQVLAKTLGWSRAKIDSVLASGKRKVVKLVEPLRIHIVYSTAWVGTDNQVHFGPDIYGRDRKLYEILHPH